jgi:hypothetical protein
MLPQAEDLRAEAADFYRFLGDPKDPPATGDQAWG